MILFVSISILHSYYSLHLTFASGVAKITHHANHSDIAGAVAAARDADYAIVFVGASSGEGMDRVSLR